MTEREFKRLLRELEAQRERLGWSQETMARFLGVSLVTYNRWLHGKHGPSALAMRAVRDRLSDLLAELKRTRRELEAAISKLQNFVEGGDQNAEEEAQEESESDRAL